MQQWVQFTVKHRFFYGNGNALKREVTWHLALEVKTLQLVKIRNKARRSPEPRTIIHRIMFRNDSTIIA